MFEFLGVDVEEGRLKEAKQEGGNTQNCAGCPHRFYSIYHHWSFPSMAAALREENSCNLQIRGL